MSHKELLPSTNSNLTPLKYARDEGTCVLVYYVCRIYKYNLGFQKANFKSRRMNNQDFQSTIHAS